jgi:hypothetical protein
LGEEGITRGKEKGAGVVVVVADADAVVAVVAVVADVADVADVAGQCESE